MSCLECVGCFLLCWIPSARLNKHKQRKSVRIGLPLNFIKRVEKVILQQTDQETLRPKAQ